MWIKLELDVNESLHKSLKEYISRQNIKNNILNSDYQVNHDNWTFSGYYLFDNLWVKKNYNWKYLLGVREIISQHGRVCLTCFEKDPKQCHRTRVAQALMRLPDIDYKFNEILL